MMLSNAGFARVHHRVENRILYRLKAPVKKMREQFLETRKVPYMVNEFHGAIYAGLLTGFVFGKGHIVIDTYKRTRKFIDVRDVADLSMILKRDRDIWYAIAGKVTFRKIMSEEDAMRRYFSPSKEALDFLEDYSFDLAKHYGAVINDKAQLIVRKAMQEGLSNSQTAANLQVNFRKMTSNRARMIARTEGTRAFSMGTLSESYRSPIIDGFTFNAVMDGLTSKICKERDGKFIPKEEIYTLASNTPPLHPNCRSRHEAHFTDERRPKLLPQDAEPAIMRESDIQATLRFLR
jgi:SPP1 gp7 family putative phage head morphogenesis protein